MNIFMPVYICECAHMICMHFAHVLILAMHLNDCFVRACAIIVYVYIHI